MKIIQLNPSRNIAALREAIIARGVERWGKGWTAEVAKRTGCNIHTLRTFAGRGGRGGTKLDLDAIQRALGLLPPALTDERAQALLSLSDLVAREEPMHDLTPEEREACVFIAYAFMMIRDNHPDTFRLWADQILKLAPQLDATRGKELLDKLLIVKGGRG